MMGCPFFFLQEDVHSNKQKCTLNLFCSISIQLQCPENMIFVIFLSGQSHENQELYGEVANYESTSLQNFVSHDIRADNNNINETFAESTITDVEQTPSSLTTRST